ncbi:hypothetical protein H0H93_000685, partial [Arthromyces matolae]
MGLNPETSKWKKIITKAEFIEMAELVDLDIDEVTSPTTDHSHRREKRSKHKHRHGENKHKHRKSHRDRSRSPYGRKTNTTPRYTSRRATDHHKSKSDYKQKHSEERKNKLTREQEDEYRASNKCFNCGEPGHMSRNCPRGRTAKASSSGKPPGLRSYSVRVNLDETERLREEALASTTQGLS